MQAVDPWSQLPHGAGGGGESYSMWKGWEHCLCFRWQNPSSVFLPFTNLSLPCLLCPPPTPWVFQWISTFQQAFHMLVPPPPPPPSVPADTDTPSLNENRFHGWTDDSMINYKVRHKNLNCWDILPLLFPWRSSGSSQKGDMATAAYGIRSDHRLMADSCLWKH